MTRIKFSLLMILWVISFYSCYEDDSSLNYKLMNPIVIDLGGEATQYKQFAFSTLEIKPITYKEGVDDADLSYKWTLEGNKIVPTVLDTTMTLKHVLDVAPESLPYKLIYEVTDNTTGISLNQVFEVTVMSPFGSGLVVCDTKDEQTSDISLIMAYNFTSGHKKENDTIMPNLFSKVNKRKIQGVATSIRSTIYGVNRSLTVGTNSTIDRVDPFDYSYIDGNGDMFIIDPGHYDVTFIGWEPNSGVELLAISGKIYPRGMQQMNKVYSYYLLTTDLSDYNMGIFCRPEWDNGIGFDEMNGRMLEFDMATKLKVFDSSKLPKDAPFDPNQLQGLTCRAMFSGDNNQMHTILQEKDPQTGKPLKNGRIASYVTLRDAWWNSSSENGKPLKIIDFTNFPDIHDAKFFDSSETQDVIYYATSNKIYAINLALSEPTATLEYSAPAGEEITSMMIWKKYQGMIEYTNPIPDADNKVRQTSTSNRMIVLTTYNPAAKEGTVRTVAIATVGTGTLEKDTKLHGAFGGFGRITATNIQDAF